MITSKTVIAFAGSVMLVRGSSAVIYSELIISKSGYIETPKIKVNQAFVETRANSALSEASAAVET